MPKGPAVPIERVMMTDEQLILDSRVGSREAFAELFQRYREPIYGFFRRRLSDAARAEELAQETFLAVINGLIRYEPRSLVRTYFYGIAVNLLAAERRKRNREGNNRAEFAEPAVCSDQQTVLWVRQALGRLDDESREVLMLREYEQLSYAEIATLLHVPVNTVRSRLFRARLALRSLLAPRADGL